MNVLSGFLSKTTKIATTNILLKKLNLKRHSTAITPPNLQKIQNQQQLEVLPEEMLRRDSTDIVWMDLEMSGLDVINHKILEVSCLITDKELNIKAEGPCLAINHPKEVFENMDEWCIKHHNESGLVKKCLESQITNEKAEKILLEFLQQNVTSKKCPLAGNSVYIDRLFLCQQMSAVHNYMHYRIIDVSTIKELIRRWNPEVLNCAPKKKFAHRSLDDIKDSIQELKYYREHFFKHTA